MNDIRTVFLALLLLLLPAFQAQAAPMMVDGTWLEQHLGDSNLVVVDMSMEDTQYQRFHLPGAVRLPYNALIQKNRNGVTRIVGGQRLSNVLGLLGIEETDHIVVYDDMGGLQAARLFWTLEQTGHPQVSVLDGGLVKWILDGRKVSNQPVKPQRVQYRLAGKGRDNNADLRQVQTAIKDGNSALLDVRSKQEYAGSPKAKRSGHIPGARWWPWEQAVDFKQSFVAANPEMLLQKLAQAGVEKGKSTIVYCQSGHRAAHTYLTLRRLGFDQVRMYDGSMAEWSQTPDAPLKKGLTP
jgi:thiosulfate/3-mercaptopyruvate sulfurtransferase